MKVPSPAKASAVGVEKANEDTLMPSKKKLKKKGKKKKASPAKSKKSKTIKGQKSKSPGKPSSPAAPQNQDSSKDALQLFARDSKNEGATGDKASQTKTKEEEKKTPNVTKQKKRVVKGKEESHFLSLLNDFNASEAKEDDGERDETGGEANREGTVKLSDEALVPEVIANAPMASIEPSVQERVASLNAASAVVSPARVAVGTEESHFLKLLEAVYKDSQRQLEMEIEKFDAAVVGAGDRQEDQAEQKGAKEQSQENSDDQQGGILDDVLAMMTDSTGKESDQLSPPSNAVAAVYDGLTDLDGDGKIDETDRLLKELSEGDLLLSGVSFKGNVGAVAEGQEDKAKEEDENANEKGSEEIAKAARDEFERDLDNFERMMYLGGGGGNGVLAEVAEEVEDDLVLDEDRPNLDESLGGSADLDNLDLSQTIHDPSLLQRNLQKQRRGVREAVGGDGGIESSHGTAAAAAAAATASVASPSLSTLSESMASDGVESSVESGAADSRAEVSPELEALVITHKLVKAGVCAKLAEKGFSTILEIKRALKDGRRAEIMRIGSELKLNKSRKRRFKEMVEEARATTAVEEGDEGEDKEEDAQEASGSPARSDGVQGIKDEGNDDYGGDDDWEDDFDDSGLEIEDKALRDTLRDFTEEDEVSKRSLRIGKVSAGVACKNKEVRKPKKAQNAKAAAKGKGILLGTGAKKRGSGVSFSSSVRVQQIPRLTSEETKELFWSQEDIAKFAGDDEDKSH